MAGIDSGSASVAGSGVKLRSMAEDLSNCLGHSELGQLVQSEVGRERVAGDGICTGESELMVTMFSMTLTVREDPHTHKV